MSCNCFPAIDGEFGLVYGTSASAPVFASIITLINDARLAVGKRPVGFINPIVGLLVAFSKHYAQSIILTSFMTPASLLLSMTSRWVAMRDVAPQGSLRKYFFPTVYLSNA